MVTEKLRRREGELGKDRFLGGEFEWIGRKWAKWKGAAAATCTAALNAVWKEIF